jgi:hypothetical protein
MAVELAHGAAKYSEATIDKKLIHAVAFGKTKEEAARASALIKIVVGWKGTQIFTAVGGANPYHIIEVLDCYLQSFSASDHQAHCHVSYLDRYRGHEELYLVPCRHLHGWFYSIVEDQELNPARFADLVQALGVRKGCSWCPNFDGSTSRSLKTVDA